MPDINTSLYPVSTQPEHFPLKVMIPHGCLLTATPLQILYPQRTIRRAINLLEKYLRQPGISFTSSTAARDWLRLQLVGQEREVFMVLYHDKQYCLLESAVRYLGIEVHDALKNSESMVVRAAAAALC